MCCAKGHRRALRGRYGDVLSHLLDQRDWNLGQVDNLRGNRA